MARRRPVKRLEMDIGPSPVIAPSSRAAVPPDLRELRDLLESKGQVVLQGPPGTGKTHLAKEYISWASAGRLDESRMQGILDALPERSIESAMLSA